MNRNARIALSIIPVLLFVLASCGIEQPQAPSWVLPLTVPLVDHHYDMPEIVDRLSEDALSIDSTGAVFFTIEEEMDELEIDAGLTVAGSSSGYEEELGIISIEKPDSLSRRIDLADRIGQAGAIPAMSLDMTGPFPIIAEIERAVISSGTMTISVTNNFGLPLDSLAVTILDDGLGTGIGSITLDGGLEKGETGAGTIVLDGRTISNALSFDLRMHTPGDSLDTLEDKHLIVEAGFLEGVTVSEATARIPAQTKSYAENVTLENENAISSASISGGSLSIEMTNGSNLAADIEILVDRLTFAGSPLRFAVPLAARGTARVTRDLAGFTLVPLAGHEGTAVSVSMRAGFPGSGEFFAEIDSRDRFAFVLETTGLELSSMAGVIVPHEFRLDTVSADIDIPDGFENFSLTGASLTMEIASTVGFPGTVELRLETGDGKRLDIPADIPAASGEIPSISIISRNDLADLLCPIPSAIFISGTAVLGNGTSAGEVSGDDRVSAGVSIVSPLEMSIGQTWFESDVNRADIWEEEISDATDRMEEASVHIAIDNHLPIDVSMTVFIGSDSLSLFSSPPLVIGPIEVASGTVGDNGLVTSPESTFHTFQLSREELQIFDYRTLFVGQLVGFPGTDGETVRIVSTDYVDLEVYMTVRLRIGGE